MRPLRLLVVEGNVPATRARQVETAGACASTAYAALLGRLAPGAEIAVAFPADGEREAAAYRPDDFDGVAITGSALNLWRAEPEAMRQVELARAVFASGVPFFGSCWGLQVAAVAAGGTVAPNPNGREIGFSRKIALTDAGRTHPMHAGRRAAFDAPTVHSDVVAVPPPDCTVTAANANTAVQAAEIRHAGGTFWGVQYHPEYSLHEVAATLRRYGPRLVEDGTFAAPEELEAHAGAIDALHDDPARAPLAWRLGVDADVLDPATRATEIANWIAHAVLPARDRRGR